MGQTLVEEGMLELANGGLDATNNLVGDKQKWKEVSQCEESSLA